MIFPGFTEALWLTKDSLNMPWQFITSIFLHANIAHLLYNLFALVFFGFMVEKLIGSKKFFYLFFISGIFANIISFNFYNASLGASGAIMALLGCLAILRPMMTVFAFGIIMPMFILAIVWIAGSVLGIFGLGDSGTGHIAHLSGVLIGVLYGFFLRLKKKEEKQQTSFTSSRKIIIPENSMRAWEDFYIKS
jgi:hypothetical protein